jgi:hypothetical protein
MPPLTDTAIRNRKLSEWRRDVLVGETERRATVADEVPRRWARERSALKLMLAPFDQSEFDMDEKYGYRSACHRKDSEHRPPRSASTTISPRPALSCVSPNAPVQPEDASSRPVGCNRLLATPSSFLTSILASRKHHWHRELHRSLGDRLRIVASFGTQIDRSEEDTDAA